jgi:hypothetical protein
MTCRLGIVGLEDEVSSHVYIGGITYGTGIIEHQQWHGIEHLRVRVRVVAGRVITTSGQMKGAPERARRRTESAQ